MAVEAIAKLARISTMITAALVTMQTLGFDITGIWAFGGIGGLAIGLAAKDLLSNFFGGLMLYMDRPVLHPATGSVRRTRRSRARWRRSAGG